MKKVYSLLILSAAISLSQSHFQDFIVKILLSSLSVLLLLTAMEKSCDIVEEQEEKRIEEERKNRE